MRKTHYKVVLDVLVLEDDLADIKARLLDSSFIIDPEQNAIDEFGDIHDISVEDVEITSSR